MDIFSIKYFCSSLLYEIDDAIWMIPTRKLVSRRFPREGNREEERERETEKLSGGVAAATMNGCPIGGQKERERERERDRQRERERDRQRMDKVVARIPRH